LGLFVRIVYCMLLLPCWVCLLGPSTACCFCLVGFVHWFCCRRLWPTIPIVPGTWTCVQARQHFSINHATSIMYCCSGSTLQICKVQVRRVMSSRLALDCTNLWSKFCFPHCFNNGGKENWWDWNKTHVKSLTSESKYPSFVCTKGSFWQHQRWFLSEVDFSIILNWTLEALTTIKDGNWDSWTQREVRVEDGTTKYMSNMWSCYCVGEHERLQCKVLRVSRVIA
jgi:hypothetical protein